MKILFDTDKALPIGVASWKKKGAHHADQTHVADG